MTQRPLIPGFHPDPSICLVGDTYYLVCSSFEYAPGVPLFASTDLRSWRQIGNVLDRPSQLNVTGAISSGGIFAPTLRHHDGRFWMITTNMTDGLGHLLVTAEDPAGPWSDPVRIAGALGIDPDLAWDDDGTCYLTWAAFDPDGLGGISQAVLDPATGDLLTGRRRLWQGSGGKHPEGPHLYRIGDYWYLLLAEGGTEQGHAVTIARGTSPAGPFEPCPTNPVITARGTASPVQNTGHADLVQRPDGSWAMVYLGVRARGTSPQWHVLGRETFASEIDWQDGWPVVGDPIEPVEPAMQVGERKEGLAAPHAWVSPGQFPDQVLRRVKDGWSLEAGPNDPAADDLSFVGRRQEHLYAIATATVLVGDAAGGLSLRIDGRHHLDLEVGDGSVRAIVQIGEIRSVLGTLTEGIGPRITVQLRMEPAPGSVFSTGFGPDRLVAGVVGDDGFVELGHLDGRYLSTQLAGGFTGRLIGLYSRLGTVTILSFEYCGSDDPDAVR
jgi:hypothetical protein